MFIDKVLTRFNNIKVVFTLREFNSLYNAFMKWLIDSKSFRKRVKRSIQRVKKMNVKTLIKRIYRLLNVLKWLFMYKPDVEWFFGLSPYCKYFNMSIPNVVNEETLHHVLHSIYKIYTQLINELVRKYSNVCIVSLEELQENTYNVITKLNDFLKPDLQIRNYSIIRKV